MKRIEEVKVLDPKPLNQWKFIPEDWTVPASKRDYDILFGEKKLWNEYLEGELK